MSIMATASAVPPLDLSGDHERRPPEVIDLAWSPDGRHVVAAYYVGGQDRPGFDWQTWVTQFDLETGSRTTIPQATAPIAFAKDGTLAMTVWDRDRQTPRTRLGVWQIGATEPYRVYGPPPTADDSIVALSFAYAGRHITTLDTSGRVRLWNTQDDAPAMDVGRIRSPISWRSGLRHASVGYSRFGGGSIVATKCGGDATTRGADDDPPTIAAWSRSRGRRDFERRTPWASYLDAASWQDRNFLTRTAAITLPTVWVEQRIAEFTDAFDGRWHPSDVVRLVPSPQNPTVAYGAHGKTVLIHPQHRPSIRHLPFGSSTGFTVGISTLAFSPDGSRLATGVARGIIRIWNIDDECFERTLRLDDRPSDTFRVAAIQAASRLGDREANVKRLGSLVGGAAHRGAKIVVLPETSISGYVSQDLKRTWTAEGRAPTDLVGIDASEVAETVPGPSTRSFAQLARYNGIYLTAPLLEIDPKTKRLYNTVVVFDPFGRQVLHYRKRNPWAWAEDGWATPGDRGTPVVDTPYGRLGVLICFDIHEQAEAMHELQIDTLLYSIAWVDDRDSDWFDTQLPDIARANDFNIVGANWTVDGGMPDWHGYGQSCVIARDGRVLAEAKDDLGSEVIFADLPLPKCRADGE